MTVIFILYKSGWPPIQNLFYILRQLPLKSLIYIFFMVFLWSFIWNSFESINIRLNLWISLKCIFEIFKFFFIFSGIFVFSVGVRELMPWSVHEDVITIWCIIAINRSYNHRYLLDRWFNIKNFGELEDSLAQALKW